MLIVEQDVEAVLHCIRYSSEAVPLGESQFMPIVFGDALTGLTQRHEDRLRLTTVCVIRESWVNVRLRCYTANDVVAAQNPMKNGSEHIPIISCPYCHTWLNHCRRRRLTSRAMPPTLSRLCVIYVGTSWFSTLALSLSFTTRLAT